MKRGLAAALALLAWANGSVAGTISSGLEAQLAGMDPGDEIKVLVAMKERADVASLDRDLHATRAPLATRHREVVGALQRTAERTQAAIVGDLEAARAAGIVRGYTPHWLINALVVVTTADGVRQLAAREDVDVIEPNLEVSLIEPVARYHKEPLEDGLDRGLSRAIGITPGVVAVGARRVWEELGITGVGAIVGNMDTGVDGTHPALAARWRGNFAPASECWRDAVGFGDATPVDRHYHGTHVMGTITGLAPNDTIGVAPGALWIADNTINQSTGSAFDNDVISGLEWFADPDGNPNTTDDVPDVIQNSWGVNENFSGYFDCDSRWWTAIDNCEAAGVVLTWSAGNEGPGAQTLRSPADRADSPYDTFSVGSTITSPPYTISDFSARGPSGCGGPYAMKPEVCAPGSDIYSAEPGGGYQYLSGTSMAGPHVAGVVALMRSANPDLDVTTVKQILMSTAVDLGAAGEDNTYGHGFIDAYEAVLASLLGYGTIEGTVTDVATSAPIAGAVVDVVGDPRSMTTDASGFFRVMLPAGTWTLDYSAFGYLPDSQPVTVVEDVLADGSLALAAAPTARVYGTVTAFDGPPVEGATVTVLDTPIAPVGTASDGTYEVFVPAGATYDLRARRNGYGSAYATVAVPGDVAQDFVLPELGSEDFESGGFLLWPWEMGGNAPWTIDAVDPYEGAYAARSGPISHSQASSMRLELTLVDPGTVSFWLKVSSEATYDRLRFLLDDVQLGAWSGAVPWTQVSFAVGNGTHSFEWRYTKDGSVNGGSDAAWVDLIEFPPIGDPSYPHVEVVPASLAITLPPDTTEDHAITLANVGPGLLQWSATTTIGPPPVTDSGGPDGAGYFWSDSDEPGGPAFAWDDIAGTGTPLGLGDDGNSGPIALGFPFEFYGVSYDSVRVCANGWLSFTSSGTNWTDQPIPDTAEPNALVAPFWDDLEPTEGGEVYVLADPGNGRFVVQFDGVPRYNTGGADRQTFQTVLRPDATISFYYQDVGTVISSSVGIENATGDDGLQVAFHSGYLHDGLAVEFTPPLPHWVVVSPDSGEVEGGQAIPLTLHVSSAWLEPATYGATLEIASNDPTQPLVVVPISLTVDPGATGVQVTRVPMAYGLALPYPNPFARSATIRFDVPPGGGDVHVTVYDVSGRRVRTLVAGPREGGRHAVDWDGTDASGRRVASGAYFVRLRAEGVETTRRIVRLN